MERDMTHRNRRLVLAATIAAAASTLVIGSQKASAQTSVLSISDTQVNPTTWQYNLTLGDTSSSTTNIGTLWYAWIPGQDYLTTKPATANITSPAGWTLSAITGGGTGDGYAIRWVSTATGDQITPGSSLSGFSFESTDPPSTIFGDSSFYPTTPTSTFLVHPAFPGNAWRIFRKK
jgi:hypothetical protein